MTFKDHNKTMNVKEGKTFDDDKSDNNERPIDSEDPYDSDKRKVVVN